MINIKIEYTSGVSKQKLKFKVGGCVRILECQNTFAKCYVPNWRKDK